MSGPDEVRAPIDLWEELRRVPGIDELSVPWPVAGAERLGVHASLRRFYRLVPPDADKQEPETLVLVVYESDDDEAVTRYARSARWFLEAGVKVPRIHDRSSRALLVEDGGDELLAEAVPGDVLDDCYAKAAAVILALQSRGLEARGPNPQWSLDAVRLRRELEFTEQHALRGWLEAEPSATRSAAFDRLAAEVARQPRRICHRDFHSRNLLMGEDLMVVDFQDAMSGPLFYDLVSLLGDDYRNVPASASAAALDAFWSVAAVDLGVSGKAGIPSEPAHLPPSARQSYALTGAQRSLKALGTFGFQVGAAGRHEYAKYARRTWSHARRVLAGLGWDDLIEDLAVFNRL